jgi:ABC-type lipoprotein export system ATPase subunit
VERPTQTRPSSSDSHPGSDEPVFQILDLHKSFSLEGHDITVLTGVEFSVRPGEWVGILGPSGSGKTTLLQLLGSLDRPTSGDILFRGRSYGRLSGGKLARLRLNEIGFVFQSYHLFPELSALENVMLPSLQWGWDRGRARRRAGELLEEFGLAERLRHRPQELSGGEQQRVALARALMNEPDVILADEPTGNLDAASSADIVRIFERLHAEENKTIVMVTHDLDMAVHADTILMMERGRALPCTDRSDLAGALQRARA